MRFFEHQHADNIIDTVLLPSDNVDWSALTNTYKVSGKSPGRPAHIAAPTSSRAGGSPSVRTDDNDNDDELARIRPWTASESLLVAALAGDERGQKAIFSSAIALPTIMAVMDEPSTAAARDGGGEVGAGGKIEARVGV